MGLEKRIYIKLYYLLFIYFLVYLTNIKVEILTKVEVKVEIKRVRGFFSISYKNSVNCISLLNSEKLYWLFFWIRNY